MTNTIDKREIEQFSSLSNKWWDKSGPFSPLHSFSKARIEFILQNANRIINQENLGSNILSGIKCLDIGCGGGILSERLARLGATVTGIDASHSSIEVAKQHSINSRLKINYKCITTSKLLEKEKKKVLNKFDMIIASEVIEHVNNRKFFLSDIANLCRSGGLVIFTTINKSFLGILLGKYFAENILKIIPSGTHDIQKFITPENLIKEANENNIILDNLTGFTPTFKIENIFNKEFGEFKLSTNMQINYGAAGIRL